MHRAQWTSTLNAYANPILGDLSVSMIQVADVMKVLVPIWTEKPETSSRLRGRIESILDYAAAQGWRSGDNSARWKGHLSKLLPAAGKVAPVRHHAAMPWKKCPTFMRDLVTREGGAAQALRFTTLTAARTSEVTGATWREMRLEGEEWVVPNVRMKKGLEHRVDLVACVDIG